MIVLDANLLLYAYDSATAEHKKARRWLESIFSGTEPVGLPWQSALAFLRIVTNSCLPGKRFTVKEAVGIVDEWIALPIVHLLSQRERHWAFLKQMLLDGKANGPLASDAELAALTMENAGVLYTTDRDFARFPGLKWVNPIESNLIAE